MRTTREKNLVAEEELQARIAQNLAYLMKDRKINISKLCQLLAYDEQVSMDRSALSKRINHPEKYRFELPILVSCADFFKVPVDALLSEDIRVYDSDERTGESFKRLLDLPQIMQQKKKRVESSSKFITDPNSDYFKKYYQKYYCYYYSTVSDENKGNDPIINGELNIYPYADECRVELLIDTKTYDDDGKVNYKKYIGTAAVSPTTLAIHCSLREENIGEYCYMIFRYSQVNFNKQDCRMAMVLSTASTPDKRYPVVQRLFMSREQIKSEDLELIMPHLCLNYSKITIKESELVSLQEMSLIHKEAIEELLNTDPELVYIFKERNVKDVAEKYFEEDEVNRFLSELRGCSMAYRNNKISPGVDKTVRDVLYNVGYYHGKGPDGDVL